MGTPTPKPSKKSHPPGLTRRSDLALGWIKYSYPQLESWRRLAEEWLAGETRGVHMRLSALTCFFEKYIVRHELPVDPGEFLSRKTVLPEFYKTSCPDSFGGARYNNAIHNFVAFVLLRHFSAPDDFGRPVVLLTHHNPIAKRSVAGYAKLDESVYSPLPYGYIDELRQMLAQGPAFRDWRWAQSMLGVDIGKPGARPLDWFKVTEDQIDKNDPDCVWRVRPRTRNAGGPVLEMWSPVRWVALLVKLIIPLRTLQVRLLDSGEADTWRYDSAVAGNWRLNTGALAEGSKRKPVQLGVFRRATELSDGKTASTVLYINSNKTADFLRSGPDKGYVMPWIESGPLHQNVFYWLEKLRNWQIKYNPVRQRMSWKELDSRYINVKSAVQLAGYPDVCFLFRLAERGEDRRHLPIPIGCLGIVWAHLLQALEDRLAARGETYQNGGRICLMPQIRRYGHDTTLYPLHSLRVSLITALALEGQVPFPILQKLVGHSRLLMTLYYTKPGASRQQGILSEAARNLEEKKEESIVGFLRDTEYDSLLKEAIANGSSTLAAAIKVHPADRNPSGWMPLHHGVCLAGGNTSEIEQNRNIGGCYNGGPLMVPGTSHYPPKHGPVPGGSRNCVRCRWFVTEAHHLPALGAHFNNLAYRFDEARNYCIEQDTRLQDLKRQKAADEAAGQPFSEHAEYRRSERMWEASIKSFSDLAEDLFACWKLIERCKTALDAPGDRMQLVASGTALDVQIGFEETESELLQLSGVCHDVEVYPDLSPGKAVLRRSQILDAMFRREGLSPGFMMLSEDQQLRLGNAFMRRLGRQANSENPELGERQAIALIDGGKKLSAYFGINLETLLPPSARSLFLRSKSVEPLATSQ